MKKAKSVEDLIQDEIKRLQIQEARELKRTRNQPLYESVGSYFFTYEEALAFSIDSGGGDIVMPNGEVQKISVKGNEVTIE
jgi:hypothetical protein